MTQLSRSRWAAIGAAVAVTLGGGGLIGVSAAGTASSFVSVDPVRILDTRQGTAGKVDDATIELQVTGAVTTYTSSGTPTATVVPSGATSVSVNLTVTEGVRNGDYGFVTAFPCASKSDAVPNASSLNFVERVDVANGLTVPLSSGGKMCLNVYGAAHLIVDVSGYFTTASAGSVDAYTKAETDALVAPLQPGLLRRRVETPVTVDTGVEPNAGTAIAIGWDGHPVITYFDEGLKVLACNDIACAGGDDTPVIVDRDSGSGRYSSIAIGAAGNPVISYHHFDGIEGSLRIIECNDPHCSGGDETPITLDSSGDVGYFTSVAIGQDGAPIVAYQDAGSANTSVKFVQCDRTCSNPVLPRRLDTSAAVGSYLSMALGIDGNPVISYWDATNKDLKFFACLNAACSAAGQSPVTLDNVGDVGTHTEITIGKFGYPVITYKGVSGALKLISCNDLRCAGGDDLGLNIVNSGVESDNAVAVGLDGLPVVAFHLGGVALDLKLVLCEEQTCMVGASNPPPITVDSTGNVGHDLSMTIAPNGYPVIAYQDFENNTLKVAVPWWVSGGR